MKKIRDYLRKWLVGDLVDLAGKVDIITEIQKEIEKHLGSVSSLADYVKEKESKAEELYSTLSQLEAGKELSIEELDEALQSAAGAKMAMLESPAIGTKEVIDKNNKLGEIEVYIRGLQEKRRAHVN